MTAFRFVAKIGNEYLCESDGTVDFTDDLHRAYRFDSEEEARDTADSWEKGLGLRIIRCSTDGQPIDPP